MRISDWSSDVCSSDLMAGGLAPQRTEIRRLEGEHLVAGSELLFQIGQRRAGPERDDQFGGFVVEHAGQPAEVEGVFTLRRAAETGLAAPAVQVKRLAFGSGPADHIDHIGGAGGDEGLGYRASLGIAVSETRQVREGELALVDRKSVV